MSLNLRKQIFIWWSGPYFRQHHHCSDSPGHSNLKSLFSRAQINLPSTNIPAAFSTASATSSNQGALSSLKKLLGDYKLLSKFKLSALVVLTSAGGFIAGSGDSIDYSKLAWTSLGTFGASACANTLNQLYEVSNDSRMTRTCNRPLPTGRLSKAHAGAFALAMGITGITILYEQANTLTAGLGAFNIFLYAGVYTPLKQISVANTWVGALVGAIPPLMGWAAASGSLELGAGVLAAALFSWQMPHFMALAWMCKEDYVRGGFKMLPSIDPLGRKTAAVALRHCLYLAPIGVLAVLAEVASWPFMVEASALSAAIGVYAQRFAVSPSQASARSMFKFSLLYLPALMVLMAVHRLPNNHSVGWKEVEANACTGLNAVAENVRQPLPVALGPVVETLDVLVGAVSTVASRIDSGIVLSYVKCPARVQCKDIDQGAGLDQQS
ncbi:hypothetical protein CEUSTIGMA_g5635.t1 [Chlamydomonas eustigma]|uniref:Heme O synthase n=1 Tax=Chlamydomonas eustigma TaxID=1157962 RepID=A0A250X543_9CHLO|nr:hypothetical protein CEUSTIGMA_g5635.t1 [Chlamydomonas eustigma]|eukprot:GAX78193.1 hypothetical protein CEUSTIGMA_g5635.t1 [Chlamydomonas eustigma]